MSDAITRLNAALEGRYAIERELGEGGMATVYLARTSVDYLETCRYLEIFRQLCVGDLCGRQP